jgi:hypothetical protein
MLKKRGYIFSNIIKRELFNYRSRDDLIVIADLSEETIRKYNEPEENKRIIVFFPDDLIFLPASSKLELNKKIFIKMRDHIIIS